MQMTEYRLSDQEPPLVSLLDLVRTTDLSRPPDAYYCLCEVHENEHTGRKTLRLINEGHENPKITLVPTWLCETLVLGDTLFRLVAFEWDGTLWGGMVHTDETQNQQKLKCRGVEDFLVSGCERLYANDRI